ncbi:MAG: hypothetical protein ACKOQ9_02240, partial [Verrucomicrobiota bacterium]
GVSSSYHDLSHHGLDEDKLRQLAIVEAGQVKAWGTFVRKLRDSGLLKETMTVMTSNLGNASSHNNLNMPVLFAGGGFRHGRHLAFDQKNNYPLPNLYLSALHRLGLEEKRFATTSGTMRGLDVA